MKKWWNDINEVYFRKPIKEELELIEPTHVIKLLNLYENDEKNLLDDNGVQ